MARSVRSVSRRRTKTSPRLTKISQVRRQRDAARGQRSSSGPLTAVGDPPALTRLLDSAGGAFEHAQETSFFTRVEQMSAGERTLIHGLMLLLEERGSQSTAALLRTMADRLDTRTDRA